MTQPTKIIFLDIDGPMIPLRAYHLPGQTGPVSMFDPCAVSMLNRLLGISQAKIVCSSTWGMMGYERWMNLLGKNGIDPNVVHEDWITPRKMSSYRIHEIKWWLDEHPEVVDYVAIDDEDLAMDFVPKAVKCDAYEGFSWRNYLECCVHLDAYEHPEPESREKFLAQIEFFKKREIWRTKRAGEQGHHLTWAAADMIFPKIDPNQDEEAQ